MGKISLSEIVTMPAFEEAGDLFYRATGMTLSFRDENGNVLFYPAEKRCNFCQMILDTPEGSKRCQNCDSAAAEKALKIRRPMAYTCHTGLTDVVVPVVVGGEKVGCFYSGQSLLEEPTPERFDQLKSGLSDLDIDIGRLRETFMCVPVVDSVRLELAISLLSVICNHLIDGEIALRRERALNQEQRKLRKAAEEKARLERDLREMEIRLVQAQLNPHFLFNALNLILGNAISEDAPQTCHLVEELSELLRNSLTRIGRMVMLSEEVSSAKAYIEIFRVRFARDVKLEIDVPDELDKQMVPALILQPLVENALVHALPRCTGHFTLKISAERKEDMVEIKVADNGAGMERKERASVARGLKSMDSEGKLTGLMGVNRRLKYYYPSNPDIRFQSKSAGTTVTISIPQK